jgi:hypothetical protein
MADLEAALNAWMEAHEAEILELLDEEQARFLANHPGIDPAVAEQNSLSMANRRFLARALGAVLPDWLRSARP